MGGNAFGVTARRLPQSQYDAIKTFTLVRVNPFFDAVLVPRNLTSKETHGDLDVLCAHDETIPGGDEAWFPNEQTNAVPETGTSEDTPNQSDASLSQMLSSQNLKPDPVLAVLPEPVSGPNAGGNIKIYGGRILAGPEVDAIRNLCGQLRQSLGATAWWRRGSEASFKMPCSLLGEAGEKGIEPEEFYQVDINFVKTVYLTFYHDMASYSATGVLLGRIVRHMSKNFTLHLTHFVLRHHPFEGLPAVDVTLTSCPSALTAWLGLDYDQWLKEGEGWSEERELFKWMTEVKEDSMLGPTLKRLGLTSRRDPNEETGKRKKRADYADRFYDWLRTESKWAAPAVADGDVTTPIVTPTPLSPSPAATPAAGQARPATSSRIVSLGDFFAQAADPEGLPNANGGVPSFYINLNPEPRSLDAPAQAALEYWGKKDEYNAVVAARRERACDVARMQYEKLQRREAAANGEEFRARE
ncbi:hypothetical protein IAT40_004349 [Kwoniella sp. CBS 6097]